MNYYDDYDEYDDEYSSSDDIFYHNYSVDYANQILSGHHAISSCLPRRRQKYRQHSPKLVRVSTLDQIPIINRSYDSVPLNSRSKYNNGGIILSRPLAPPRLPTLEATSEELERRATRGTQPINQVTSNTINDDNHNNGYNPLSDDTSRPLSEAELRQVQQQQEAFQQHLLNMQRHLMEQSQELQGQQEPHKQEQRVPKSRLNEKRTKVSFHELELDDDQAKIAELIENDPYIAAAMEDFAYTHGLLDNRRQRIHSDNASSHDSQLYCKRHRSQHSDYSIPRSPSPSSSTLSSLTNVTSDMKGSNVDMILVRELHGIRRLIEEYVRGRNNMSSWPISGGPFVTPTGIHYPTVPSITNYEPSRVPTARIPPPDPNRVKYQNVVNAVREVIDRRSPSQREQPLKPSQIDPTLKHLYTRRAQILPSNPSESMSNQKPPLPQQQRRRRSSQMSTPPIIRNSASPSTNIPPAPPYEPLLKFSSFQSTTNQNRNLSYGNRQRQFNIYDRLLPGHYLGLYKHK